MSTYKAIADENEKFYKELHDYFASEALALGDSSGLSVIPSLLAGFSKAELINTLEEIRKREGNASTIQTGNLLESTSQAFSLMRDLNLRMMTKSDYMTAHSAWASSQADQTRLDSLYLQAILTGNSPEKELNGG